MKRAWILAVLTVASVTGLGYVHPFGNPRVEPARGLGTLLQSANLPPDAKAVLVTKCADCHSSETRWPVYARVAPGSWLIERDIVEARKHMNLSRWELLSMEQQQVLLAKISHEAKSGDMPPIQYVALHWGAKLSQTDVHTLSMLGKNAGDTEATLVGPAMRGGANSYLTNAARVATPWKSMGRGPGYREFMEERRGAYQVLTTPRD